MSALTSGKTDVNRHFCRVGRCTGSL